MLAIIMTMLRTIPPIMKPIRNMPKAIASLFTSVMGTLTAKASMVALKAKTFRIEMDAMERSPPNWGGEHFKHLLLYHFLSIDEFTIGNKAVGVDTVL